MSLTSSPHTSHSSLEKPASDVSSLKESLTTGGSEGLELQSLTDLEHLAQGEEKSGYYYLGYNYVRPTRADYERKKLRGAKLFDKEERIKKTKDNETYIDETKRDASILVTGFSMRNVDSFQRILRMSEEEREKAELRKLWRDKKAKEVEISEQEDEYEHLQSSSTSSRSRKTTSDFVTQTETTIQSSADDKKRQMEYLLGLESQPVEEEPEPTTEYHEEEPVTDHYSYSSSKSMREAQQYLRTHRIFEFFQFIVAHMLSAKADNPIEFILNLLNKCLLYRSGLGEPPLLYTKKHIEQLFGLMDRLRTGYIDLDQYKTGIQTLGICSYNEHPQLSEDGMISQETFIIETYEAELDIFGDLIKRRLRKKVKPCGSIDSNLGTDTTMSLDQAYFIPPAFFKPIKEDKYDFGG